MSHPETIDLHMHTTVSDGTDTPEAIEARLVRARQEYQEADFYDYIIVNDDLETAAEEFSAIITAAHCRFDDRRHIMAQE